VLWWPALADGSVLGRLTSPREVLASPLLLPAAAALLIGRPGTHSTLALLLLALLLSPNPPSTPRTERLSAATGTLAGTPQPAARYSPPTRALDTASLTPHTGDSSTPHTLLCASSLAA
jgi:hypothetical protein